MVLKSLATIATRHTGRKWTATLEKFNSVVGHCEKNLIMQTFEVI